MKKTNWNNGWYFYKDGEEQNKRLLDLPHDAMIEEKRSVENGNASGFFPGGKYIYEKTLIASEELLDKTVVLEFEGVYMNSTVILNDEKVGGHIYGYTGFFVELTGKLKVGENLIKVIADNSLTPNSRWYSGSGIYRDVNLYVGNKEYFIPNGIRVTTVSLNPAIVRVECETTGAGTEITAQIKRNDTVVAVGKGKDFSVEIPDALVWSAEEPNLYELCLSLEKDSAVLDVETVTFGIRQLAWNAVDGFTVNGKTVKLKGGCIHHDNGLLGGCESKKATYRKIRKLKEFGFNAIRYSHYPASKAVLEVCDELGMYILDESFDQWKVPQSKYDYALSFDVEWQKDLSALIRKDYNHPSVIMYCIGNEITDVALLHGKAIAKMLYDFVQGRDATRAIIIANNGLLNVLTVKVAEQKAKAETKENVGSSDANEIVAQLPKIMESLTAEMLEGIAGGVFETVDIVGYNYGNNLYEKTHEMFPERIILSSETFPARIGKNWAQVESNSYVIGDFMWTAWDYIGEAGVGLPFYGTKQAPFSKPYPCMLAGCGSFDITGFPESQAYYSAVIWGAYKKPYIAVRPVHKSGEDYVLGNWRLTDAINSWSWKGQEGKTAEISVYSIGSTVELILNGESLGKKPLEYCRADFTAEYKKGTLAAISYDESGKEIDRSELTSAEDEIVITAIAEETEIKEKDFTYINVSLTDKKGNVQMLCDRKVYVKVEGAGRLRAVGSGNPLTEESFLGGAYTTYYGRMQAVVEGTGKGEIKVAFSADDIPETHIVVTVK